MTKIAAGTWVELERVLLAPGERSPNLPEDTRLCSYVLRISGFLLEEAGIGEPARVKSLIGHEHAGTLRLVNPGYTHSFGETVPELLTIGTGAKP